MAVVGSYADLGEALKLVQARLLAGVIEEIIEEGQLISILPVQALDSVSLDYRRELAIGDAEFVDMGGDITPAADITFTEVTVSLKRLARARDLDKFVRNTYRNPNDLEAQVLAATSKAVLRTAEDTFIYGSATANPLAFNGLQALCAAAQRINQGAGSTGAPLSLAKLDLLIDSVKPRPDILLMSFNLNRRISAIGRGGTTSYPLVMREAQGSDIQAMVTHYRGIPLMRSDYILQTESISGGNYSAKTAGATSSIIALRKGSIEEGGVALLTGTPDGQGGPPMFKIERIDQLENKDAIRFRFMSYLAMALGSTKALGIIDGITDEPVED